MTPVHIAASSMWSTGRQNDSSTGQIRRNLDLLAIPRRRAHSLDSIDTLDAIDSHRQHRLAYLKNRAKFEDSRESAATPPAPAIPSRRSSTLSAIVNNSSIGSSPPLPDSAADTLGEMLKKITSELNQLQQEDPASPTPGGPVTRATIVERYIPAQVPMRATIVSAGSDRSPTTSGKNRVSFDSAPPSVLPDRVGRDETDAGSSFQFQRPSTFLRQSSDSLGHNHGALPDFRAPRPPHDIRLGRHGYGGVQNFQTLPPLRRQLSSAPSQDFHTPRPIRRHVSFSSVPLGDMPRRSTTSSVPVKTLIKKFSLPE